MTKERLLSIEDSHSYEKPLDNHDVDWLIEKVNELFSIVSDNDEIEITKYKRGEPTVIDWNGQRWIRDAGTTRRG